MRSASTGQRICGKLRGIGLLVLLLCLGLHHTALGFSLRVVDHEGAPMPNGFAWLLEEDNTNQPVLPTPGQPVAPTTSISLDIHNSYAPLVDKGRYDNADSLGTVVVPDPPPGKRYFLSVLPDAGFSIGGAAITDTGEVTVVVHALPIPTAQISIFVFEDHNPINNAPDAGETGIQNATVILHDAAGQLMQDAFGNPIGTTYDQAGNVIAMGNGTVKTDADGNAIVKFLAPGKYGVVITPPTVDGVGAPAQYIQTSTIEGTKTIDAWVKANEPELFVEGFGTGFNHVFVGFVNPDALPWNKNPDLTATGNINGQLRYNHFSRPPANQGFFAGPPVKDCWVGLNDPVSGQGLYAAPCFEGAGTITGGTIPVEVPSAFYIPNVPPGTYELVTWDTPLDSLFGFHTVTVPPGGLGTGDPVDLGKVLAFRWFGSFIGTVFLDKNENGFQDAGEIGLAEQNINIRFRDGTIYQAQPTDIAGGYALEEVFPFFKWLVPEVDFARFKATGMTTAVDYGGLVPPADGWITPSFDQLTPQPQDAVNPNTENNLSRTEKGEVLTQAMHLFLSQTNVVDWGKNTYKDGENGGISGVVLYAVTRAENDPRFAAGEEWERGIPRVQVNLYQDFDSNGVIDDLNKDGQVTVADVDNYPFGNFPGDEDVDHNTNGGFDPGDAISITTTDSWDDNKPSGCVQDLPVVHGQQVPECADAFGTWNQMRPGVFDGGYAFGSYYPGGIASGSNEVDGLPSGKMYIIEAATPPGYEPIKEEDKNVDFGDINAPSPLLLPPVCVGEPHTVPEYLSFQTYIDADGILQPLPDIDPAELINAPFAGQARPLCDRKQLGLNDKENGAVDFFFFTKVPKAARAVGFVNNDLSAEFNQGSPNFGEKATPSWIPVSFKDWKGNEIVRVYTDEFGGYNAMLPSTYTVNQPTPTGVSPNMLTLVLNDPFLPDGSLDPRHDPNYSVTPWTFHYEAGRTTYLDTPLVPVAAFANSPQGQLVTKAADGTPVINEVTGPESEFGPLVCIDRLIDTTETTVTITSLGPSAVVDNPDYDPFDPASSSTVTRDYGFGTAQGQVLINGSANGITINSWTETSIEITVDTATVATTGVLTVERGDNGKTTETGVTLNMVTDCNNTTVRFVAPGPGYPATPIQDAIDAAASGDLILVAKGSYSENVIMYKPVRLQGAGPNVTFINANPAPTDKLAAWHTKIRDILALDSVTPALPDPFVANEAPGIMVVGHNASYPIAQKTEEFGAANPALIDGFTIAGAIAGGGITVHNDVSELTISSNKITNNQGIFGGGIAIGIPDVGAPAVSNPNVTVRDNLIVKNGGVQGAGGIAIYNGATDYVVENNLISGNLSRFNGGGISHVGLSNNGMIRNNRILFNEIFYGLLFTGAGNGGGIYIGGDRGHREGAGSVTVDANLIQGNLNGSGNGGGIAVDRFNDTDGIDVTGAPGTPGSWNTLTITNNIIVNNVAGFSGGGLSLKDAGNVTIANNTIADNDSTATAALAFQAGNFFANSTPQPAGIVAQAHSPDLAAVAGGQTFTDPALANNIIWHNRSFYNDATRNANGGGLVFASHWDLAVIGTAVASQMSPTNCVLTSLNGPSGEIYDNGTNIAADPAFVRSYFNNLVSAAVLDEGGNFISVLFNPLEPAAGDYHLTHCSPAVDAGLDNSLTTDIDGDARPAGSFDIGADEFVASQTVYDVLTILSPVTGEIIPGGSTYTISWGAPDTMDTFRVEYQLDAASPWIEIATDIKTTCFIWDVPVEISVQDQVQIRVTGWDSTAPDPPATEDEIISDPVTLDVVALISPNGGETLTSGTTHTITWKTYTGITPVDHIELSYQLGSGAPWVDITTALPGNAVSHAWTTVPNVDALTSGVRVRLRLFGFVDPDPAETILLEDISDGPFFIQPTPPLDPPPDDLVVDPPTGGQNPPPPPTTAGVNFQCPGFDPDIDSDLNGDGMLRAGDGEISAPLTPNQVCMHLAAGDGFVVMADGRPQYMFGFSNVTGIPDEDVMNMWPMGGMLNATFPAPLIKVKQGDQLYLTLTNVGMMMRPDLFDPHTIHWHGFPQAASIFDGVPEASVSINMGSSLTYYYNVVEAGTFMYHCHVEATEHMQMGMLGNLYVAPSQDGNDHVYDGKTFNKFAYNDGDGSTGYDREYHFQITAFDPAFHDASQNTQPLPFADMDDKYPMLNGRGYPDTVNEAVISFSDPADPAHQADGHPGQTENSLIKASPGEHILLRISSLSTTSFHTLTVLGLPLRVVGKGSRKLGPTSDSSQYYYTNSITLGGGQSVDVILEIPATVDAGDTFFLYTTNLDHLTNNDEDYGGMMTEIVIQ